MEQLRKRIIERNRADAWSYRNAVTDELSKSNAAAYKRAYRIMTSARSRESTHDRASKRRDAGNANRSKGERHERNLRLRIYRGRTF